jgi:hypothetical protein
MYVCLIEISSTFSSVGASSPTIAVKVDTTPPPTREIPRPQPTVPERTHAAHAPPPAKTAPPPAKTAPSSGGGKWKVGDDCQAVWDQDGAWYKAKITATKGAGRYAVLFTEYNQTGEVTEDQIKPMPAPRRQ